MQVAPGARRRDVKQPPLFFEIIELILKPVRRKPSVRHPDQKHVVPLKAFRRVHGRERDKATAASIRVPLDYFGGIERYVVKQLRGSLVTLRDGLQMLEVASTPL